MKIYFHLNIAGFSNSYLVMDEKTKEALIVDPGKITGDIIDKIESEKYALTSVLITHNHATHIAGLKTLQKIYSLNIYAADWEVAKENTTVIKGEGSFTASGLVINHMSLPGHSFDSVVYKIGNVLFTGDTIYAGRIATTNNKFSEHILISNIQNKIFTQRDDTVIMPGHGPITSVLAEKQFNTDLLTEKPAKPDLRQVPIE
ncbi:MAG: MBL fold metallo-hydrolase [Treponema sp.]|nr:MBL fold metallo-hydrolase [Treponema sp.]